jgi:hypothetical protein
MCAHAQLGTPASHLLGGNVPELSVFDEAAEHLPCSCCAIALCRPQPCVLVHTSRELQHLLAHLSGAACTKQMIQNLMVPAIPDDTG